MIDNCEPEVISALQKDGWQVARKPYMVFIKTRYVYADLGLRRGANHHGEQVVVLEVKCFANPKHDLQELYTAIGQYLFYQTALQYVGDYSPLYLALPTTAYKRFQQDAVIMATLAALGINMVIIDVENEEVDQWLQYPKS